MTLQIDIARLLANKAGEHLSMGYTFSKRSEKPDIMSEAVACIQAVILFQSAMEAMITEEIENEKLLEKVKKSNAALYTKHKSLSFKNKWEHAYEVLKIKDRKPLEEYLSFYSEYRIPISHPQSRYITLENYTYDIVEKGMKNGWEASQSLFKAMGKKTTSWEEYKKMNGLR